MYAFDYKRAASVSEAAGLAAKDGEAKILAGGQTLIRNAEAAPRPADDAHRPRRHRRAEGHPAQRQRIAIGAMTTHAEIASSAA